MRETDHFGVENSKEKKERCRNLPHPHLTSLSLQHLLLSLSRFSPFHKNKTPQRKSMAATLCFLKIPILHPKPHRFQSKLPNFTNPTKHHLSEDSNYSQKLFTESIRLLKSASLPLTALTIPFFFDPMASSTLSLSLFHYLYNITMPPHSSLPRHVLFILSLNLFPFGFLSNRNSKGCMRWWWRFWNIGGTNSFPHSSICDECFVPPFSMGWISGLAMATNPYDPK